MAHLVRWSPWPALGGLTGIFLATRFIVWFQFGEWGISALALVISATVGAKWWIDVRSEGVSGEYTPLVVDGIQLGMLWFLFSELCFFGAFFWSFFHFSLSPAVEIGNTWPPVGLHTVNPIHLPLLNTVVLLRRGATVTLAHHLVVSGSRADLWMWWTVALGSYFTFLQAMEYINTHFTIRDRRYGAIFFIATGFHGTHVIIGAVTLSVSWWRIRKGLIGVWDHLGLELAIWYWHFVDVIWLILFVVIYWWGGA